MTAAVTTSQAALVAAEERRNPLVAALARLAALAARVEPELVRRLRLVWLPGADASTEADLWFGRLVSARGPDVMVFAPGVLDELRRQLRPGSAGARARLEAVAKTIREVHDGSPPLVQLEDRLIVQLLLGEGDVDAGLRGVLGSMVQEPRRRSGLASWAWAALPHLPYGETLPPSAGPLMVATSLLKRAPVPMAAAFAAPALARTPPELIPAASDDVDLEIRRSGERLIVDHATLATPKARRFKVPATTPRYVEVEPEGGPSTVVALAPAGPPAEVRVTAARVLLRNLRGDQSVMVQVGQPGYPGRPVTVLVAGLAYNLSAPQIDYAVELGRALAEAGHSLVDGGQPGVDFLAGARFAEVLRRQGGDVGARLLHLVAGDDQPDYGGGAVERASDLEASFTERVLRADAVVIIAGKERTGQLYLMAREAGVPVLPIGASGGMAAEASRDLDRHSEERWRALRAVLGTAAPAEAADLVAQHLRATPPPFRDPSRRPAVRRMWLASTYLLGTLDEANAVMTILWREMDQARAALPEYRRRLGNRFTADRVLAYVAVQVDPRADDVRRLGEGARIERELAPTSGETRPLWQLLVALQRHLDESVDLPREWMREEVEQIQQMLAASPDIDRGGQCKSLAAELIGRLGAPPDAEGERWPSVADLAEHYVEVGRDARAEPVSPGPDTRSMRIDTPSGRWVLTRLDAEPGAATTATRLWWVASSVRAERAVDHLRGHGIRAPRLVRTRGGESLLDLGPRGLWRLAEYLEGTIFAHPTGTAQAHAAGLFAGRLHGTLASLTLPEDAAREPDNLQGLHAALVHQPPAEDSGALGRAILDAADRVPPVPGLPRQPCHCELWYGNILFASDRPDEPTAVLCPEAIAPDDLGLAMGNAWRNWCARRGEAGWRAAFDLPLFEAALDGFRQGLDRRLSPEERQSLLVGIEWATVKRAARLVTHALEVPDDRDRDLAGARAELNLHHAIVATRAARASLLEVSPP
jgi:hypothetical protein